MSAAGRPVLAAALLVALVARPGKASAQLPDSLLASACAGGAGMAEGLLFVEFRADIDPVRRAAMAKEGGGALAAGDGPSAAYVLLPPGARTDLAADRLIRLDGVQSVADVACPAPAAPPPAAAAARPDSARADTTARPGTARADTTARPDTAARPTAADTTGRPAPADSTAPPPGPI